MTDFVGDCLHELRTRATDALKKAKDGICFSPFAPSGLTNEEFIAYWEEQVDALNMLCHQRDAILERRKEIATCQGHEWFDYWGTEACKHCPAIRMP